MVRNGLGGGNTQSGIAFEDRVDIVSYLNDQVEGYSCIVKPFNASNQSMGYEIFYNDNLVAESFKKHELYRYLEFLDVNWENILSKKLLPDNTIYVIQNNTVFIIEIKYQEVGGSVDEKLQTCDFKLKQYRKLFSVEYIYILNNWFNDDKYRDTLDYIIDMNCKYYFEFLPLQEIGLPIPEQQ